MTPISDDGISLDIATSKRARQPLGVPEVTTTAMEAFSCLAERCPDTCCRDWAVPIDRPGLEQMKAALGSTTKGRDRLVHLVVLGRPSRHADDATYIRMDESGDCPLLETDNRCGVHAALGEQALTTACSVFPRTALAVEDRIEVGGSLACPEVARLTLLSEQELHLRAATKPMLTRTYIGKTITFDVTDAYAHHFIDARAALLDCFRRSQKLGTNLVVAADLAERLRAFFYAGTREFEGAQKPFAERRLHAEIEETNIESLQLALERDLDALDTSGEVVTGLVATFLLERRRLPHSSRFSDLLDRILASAARENPELPVGTDAAVTPEALWRAYARRRDLLAARLDGRSARIFRNYCQHFLMRNPYTDFPTLLEYLYRLAIHLAAIRLLTVLHPDLETRLSARPDHESDLEVFDRVAVGVIQTFTKAIGHHPDYLDAALRRSTSESSGFTFGRLVLLAKFV